jgi:hypothetical protein
MVGPDKAPEPAPETQAHVPVEQGPSAKDVKQILDEADIAAYGNSTNSAKAQEDLAKFVPQHLEAAKEAVRELTTIMGAEAAINSSGKPTPQTQREIDLISADMKAAGVAPSTSTSTVAPGTKTSSQQIVH